MTEHKDTSNKATVVAVATATTQCTICGKTITISIQEHFIKRHQHKKDVIYDI